MVGLIIFHWFTAGSYSHVVKPRDKSNVANTEALTLYYILVEVIWHTLLMAVLECYFIQLLLDMV